MNIFLYEWVTGGGLIDCREEEISASLAREGRAMAAALATDLVAIGAQVDLMADERLLQPFGAATFHPVDSRAGEMTTYRKLAAAADATIVIAPEFDRILEHRATWVTQCGGRLIGPSRAAISLSADKHRTAQHLSNVGISSTEGIVLQKSEPLPLDFPYPAILKPRYGAGSQEISSIAESDAAKGHITNREMRLERFVAGMAASVAVLCGPKNLKPLPACRQLLSTDGHFTYLGGSYPLEENLEKRARRLATQAVASFDGMLGYVGVDLLLGKKSHEDTVVEVNPRLTTSYIALRRACRGNLAEMMLQVADGQDCTPLFFDTPIDFDCFDHRSLVSLS